MSRSEVSDVQTSPEVFQTDPCARAAQYIAIKSKSPFQIAINVLSKQQNNLSCIKLSCAYASCVILAVFSEMLIASIIM